HDGGDQRETRHEETDDEEVCQSPPTTHRLKIKLVAHVVQPISGDPAPARHSRGDQRREGRHADVVQQHVLHVDERRSGARYSATKPSAAVADNRPSAVRSSSRSCRCQPTGSNASRARLQADTVRGKELTMNSTPASSPITGVAVPRALTAGPFHDGGLATNVQRSTDPRILAITRYRR